MRPSDSQCAGAQEGVLSSDVDGDDDTLAATIEATTVNGTLTFAADGSFTYTPNAGFVGADSFTYRVSDGVTTSEPVTVILDVTNTAPTGADSSYIVHQGATLTAGAPGLLSGALDYENDSLTVTITAQPTNGALSASPDGTCTYTPATGYVGDDSFQYTLSDSIETTAPYTARSRHCIPRDDERRQRLLVVRAECRGE